VDNFPASFFAGLFLACFICMLCNLLEGRTNLVICRVRVFIKFASEIFHQNIATLTSRK
jgi:hypothetical protein